MKILYAVQAALVLLCLSVAAQADLITCTFTSSGSGRLAGTPFLDSNFTITAVADNANRYVPPANEYFPSAIIYSIDNTSASITIEGLGTYTFLTATRIFNNLSNGSVGFSRAGDSPWDIFDIQNVPALCSWDMLTSFAPISVGSSYMQWREPDVYTSGGLLEFESSSKPSTFTATVVPEPLSSITLFCGVCGLVSLALNKKWRYGWHR